MPFRALFPALALLLTLGMAQAEAGILSVFNFSGDCADCTGTGTGQLVLTDYTIGTPITQTNFSSFTYYGSNLLGAFTIGAGQTVLLEGAMSPPLPGSENFLIYGTNGQLFSSVSTGGWCVGSNCELPADYGFTHLWSTAVATSVPEPMSVTILAGALAGALAVRRRRRRG